MGEVDVLVVEDVFVVVEGDEWVVFVEFEFVFFFFEGVLFCVVECGIFF